MNKVRIIVADDHEVVRQGLRSILEAQRGWVVCGEAATGREAIEKAKKLKPDVIVLDIEMPDLGGVEATRRIRKEVPETEILILTMHEPRGLLRKVTQAGARGYILKTDAIRELVTAVEALKAHKPFFSSSVLESVVESYSAVVDRPSDCEPAHELLTPRERDVMILLAQAKGNKEVGTALGISTRTAEAHRTNIMRKLTIHSMADLVRYAIRMNLIQP